MVYIHTAVASKPFLNWLCVIPSKTILPLSHWNPSLQRCCLCIAPLSEVHFSFRIHHYSEPSLQSRSPVLTDFCGNVYYLESKMQPPKVAIVGFASPAHKRLSYQSAIPHTAMSQLSQDCAIFPPHLAAHCASTPFAPPRLRQFGCSHSFDAAEEQVAVLIRHTCCFIKFQVCNAHHI